MRVAFPSCVSDTKEVTKEAQMKERERFNTRESKSPLPALSLSLSLSLSRSCIARDGVVFVDHESDAGGR